MANHSFLQGQFCTVRKQYFDTSWGYLYFCPLVVYQCPEKMSLYFWSLYFCSLYFWSCDRSILLLSHGLWVLSWTEGVCFEVDQRTWQLKPCHKNCCPGDISHIKEKGKEESCISNSTRFILVFKLWSIIVDMIILNLL